MQGLKICVVTGIPPLNLLVLNFVRVLVPTVEKLVLITGNYPKEDVFSPKIKLINIKADSRKQSILIRIPKFVFLQLRMAYCLATNMSQARIVVFFLDGGLSLLPMLVARLVRKRTIVVVTYSSPQIARQVHQNSKEGVFMSAGMSLLERLNYKLTHKLVVYSPNVVSSFGLERYHRKISIAHRHFLDFDKFKIKRKFDERANLVGYIGRLSQEKGTLNFVEAIPEISKGEDGVRFVIGGDGQLRDEIGKYLDKENLNGKVKLPGWIPHDELPDYLNQLKLLILPSYTEGLPNIMLEAMACGTPVLATPVGAIPDVIKDEQTGFIMEDNSPECISRNVIRALNHPNLQEITRNARTLIEQEFTYEKAVERYRKIINELSKVD